MTDMPTEKEIKKLCKDILVQELYQKLGMNQKDDDHTPKVRWHAKGGHDLALWLINENPWVRQIGEMRH